MLQENKYYEHTTYWQCQTDNPYKMVWRNAEGQPVINAPVALFDENEELLWTARTNHLGEAVFWPGALEAQAIPSRTASIKGYWGDEQYVLKEAKPYRFKGEEYINEVTWETPTAASNSNGLEVMFVIDGTGSMGDELNYLKLELESVIGNLQKRLPALDMRLGAMIYRDHTDDYLLRKADLTANTASVFNFIMEQNADGGGDFPEAVDEALEAAIQQQDWKATATNRLLFLLLDAPPHQDEASIQRLHQSLRVAAERGIQIIPIASSGIDKETEFLLRFMAQLTNGTYTFITDHSGVGNAHLEPTVGAYKVEYLNDLLLRLLLERTGQPVVQ